MCFMRLLHRLSIIQVLCTRSAWAITSSFGTKSGIRPWVDVTTPVSSRYYMSSRGERWELVMSDEFGMNAHGLEREFGPGKDHFWTSLEKPDGVNGALEVYSHNMTRIRCENQICFLEIKTIEDEHSLTIYNQYARPPGFSNITFYYRSAMLQSWNKFCFQGGMLEVRAQLPGAINPETQNPDLKNGASGPVQHLDYYPVWPGIWMMGNLGRAIFSGSTQRMWPFSYNDCDDRIFNSSNQRINACNSHPGHGMHPFQGRGAPEIDLIEGGGTVVSASIQIAPGMHEAFRKSKVDAKLEVNGDVTCKYSASCHTIGANYPNVPSSIAAQRGHKSWYQRLRYSSNDYCQANATLKQSYKSIINSLSRGIFENNCTIATCPASFDVESDLDYINGDPGRGRWGINDKGTCFSVINAYDGTYLCDPDNTDSKCLNPRSADVTPTNSMPSFNYQMDAISANWHLHVGAYTAFVNYQLEWVTGKDGYVRWMLEKSPLFEIPASTLIHVPQDVNRNNPIRKMVDEPMYLILNVAVSGSWGATPPNPGRPCRGDGADEKVNRICSSFPMYLKVDHIRLYQDVSNNSRMTTGCDPETHPTKTWIEDHMDEYEDSENKYLEVQGGASCTNSSDCAIVTTLSQSIQSGYCSKGRCLCTSFWGGPRCTVALSIIRKEPAIKKSHGPPLWMTSLLATVTIIISCGIWLNLALTKRRILRNSHENYFCSIRIQ